MKTFTTALYIPAKTTLQSPSISEERDKSRDSHVAEHYSAINRSELLVWHTNNMGIPKISWETTETRHKGNTVGFHWYDLYEQAKLILGDRNQNSGGLCRVGADLTFWGQRNVLFYICTFVKTQLPTYTLKNCALQVNFTLIKKIKLKNMFSSPILFLLNQSLQK